MTDAYDPEATRRFKALNDGMEWAGKQFKLVTRTIDAVIRLKAPLTDLELDKLERFVAQARESQTRTRVDGRLAYLKLAEEKAKELLKQTLEDGVWLDAQIAEAEVRTRKLGGRTGDDLVRNAYLGELDKADYAAIVALKSARAEMRDQQKNSANSKTSTVFLGFAEYERGRKTP